MQITFLGATETVTGSKFLLTHHGKKILVDCGLFQGYKALRLRNWDKFPVDPAQIDAVILTHAHIDHTGYLPLLVKNGFSGKIHCTHGTKDLCAILLPDSGHIQEEDAKRANKYGYSKHHPALPLYTENEGRQALKQFLPHDFATEYRLFDDLSFRFHHAGHIIGASIVEIKYNSKTLCFTGDLGRPHDHVMNPPDVIHKADYLVIESTYGGRLHDRTDPLKQLEDIIQQTVKRGGSVIIPSFAVGRAQSLLYYIDQLKKADRIPDLPVFLDSPMAINATNLLCHYTNEHRLTKEQCKDLCNVAEYIVTPEQSKSIDQYKVPVIIISASGMATGGRILHHLKLFLRDPRSTILFAGFQAGGTRGDRLLRGETEIKIHGEMIPVRAHIELLTSLSAHADYQEILAWLKKFERPPQKTFIVHGEPESSKNLKRKIEEQLKWSCYLPKYRHVETL
ncbi:MBL fold metallo-hydrolase RNA specificity domain-containing protein [Aquicella lusitana]|uniref:Metallo-beta-lactamase family protein n=1 Tax=Aquicella lusitana TaxID=254246 RepID=A0A370GLZ2_9COXI|nr:MBL fold metallo-hydrolase [Aquicella lusitana]RDI43424.1 metallo-beta-lactamase family protein [Aquicella lusitana]VVC73574.1 Ribonuclease [Aquicella lusitana]